MRNNRKGTTTWGPFVPMSTKELFCDLHHLVTSIRPEPQSAGFKCKTEVAVVRERVFNRGICDRRIKNFFSTVFL